MAEVSQPVRSKAAGLEPATYSLQQLARLLGVGSTAAYGMAQSGRLPVTPIRVGRQYRFPKAEVDRLLGIDTDTSAPTMSSIA